MQHLHGDGKTILCSTPTAAPRAMDLHQSECDQDESGARIAHYVGRGAGAHSENFFSTADGLRDVSEQDVLDARNPQRQQADHHRGDAGQGASITLTFQRGSITGQAVSQRSMANCLSFTLLRTASFSLTTTKPWRRKKGTAVILTSANKRGVPVLAALSITRPIS